MKHYIDRMAGPRQVILGFDHIAERSIEPSIEAVAQALRHQIGDKSAGTP